MRVSTFTFVPCSKNNGTAIWDGLIKAPARPETRIQESLLYPLWGATGVALLVLGPPLLWFISVPFLTGVQAFTGTESRFGLGMLLIMILGPLAASLIQLAISRSREYEADASGAQLTGNPLALAGALRKLEHGTKQLPLPPEPRIETASHMMIANPFRSQDVSKLFSTHPPVHERVHRLEVLAGGRHLH